MKKFTLILALMFAIMALSGCDYEKSSTEKEADKTEQQLSQYSIGQPVPAFDWSLERELVIKLYNLRNTKVATHTVWRSDFGMIEGDTPSIGFGIPYDTSLTNPLQLSMKSKYYAGSRNFYSGTVEQQEPNGIFASKNTTATWVMSSDVETGNIAPIYVESKVTVYPYPITVDYATNRVVRAGTSTVTISVK